MANYKLLEKKQEGDQTIISLGISKEIFKQRKDKVFNRLSKEVDITGFRKGKAPKAMVEARLGASLYEKTLNELLPEVTYEFLTEEKMDFLGGLNYQVTKVSEEDGVEYNITFVKYPKINLPDFKKIKVSKEKVELTDKEVDEEIEKIVKYQSKDKSTKSEGDKKGSDMKADEKENKKLDDTTVKDMGLGLNTVKELKDLVRKQLEQQKENTATNKQLQAIVDEAVKKSKIEAPETLVDQEVHKREHEYEHRIEEIGLKLDEFLKTQNTSLEDLRKDWKKDAERQIKTDLLLFEIAKANELKVTNEEIKAELDAITDENLRKQYDSYEGRNYISGVILQQKSLNWIVEQTGIMQDNKA